MEILLFNTRRFLTGVMHVQLDNTKQDFSARNDQVEKTIVALKPIWAKILLDKD